MAVRTEFVVAIQHVLCSLLMPRCVCILLHLLMPSMDDHKQTTALQQRHSRLFDVNVVST